MQSLAVTLKTIWRLAVPYFRSDERWSARLLLASVIAMELAIVAINVLINQWYARFYNSLQDRDAQAFMREIMFFCVLAAIYVACAVYQLYLNQWLQIRWRRWMTGALLSRWLDRHNHYRMQLTGDAADNPDQRIAEDIKLFIENGLTLGVGMLGAAVTLGSFVFILWGLSREAPLTLFGEEWRIPGYLVWAALAYAVLGTWLTHLIGRPLIGLYFDQQRYEADFRFNLVRVRENAEQIALLAGEPAERERLLDRFGRVIGNWFRIMSQTKRVTSLTSGYSQISTIFPYIVVSPAYFSGRLALGGLMQTAAAFTSVQTALSFFVTSYRQIAEWRAVVDRLAGFEAAMAAGDLAPTGGTAVSAGGATGGIAVETLELRLPSGAALASAADLRFNPGDHVLVTGPSGSGKSTLFRAIAGIWPFASGRLTLPQGARVMVLPQRPYFPVGTLEAAVSYPALPGRFDRDTLRGILRAVGLPAFTEKLDEPGHWNRMLSLGEQQRLALARAILEQPDYLFLDEATASLDEPSETALYRLLTAKLPGTTIVSIGHRSTLKPLHDRLVNFEPAAQGHRVRESALATAEG